MAAPLRILIGTAEPTEADRLRAALEALGYTVAGNAPSGEAAIASAEALGAHLVLFDLRMPGGLDAVGKLMVRRPAPILALGADYPAAIEHALGAGVMGYLVPPVRPKDLAPAIALALARFRELLALRKEVESTEEASRVERQVTRAKAILVKRLRVSEAEAHRRLLRLAQQERCTLMGAAGRIIVADKFLAEIGKP